MRLQHPPQPSPTLPGYQHIKRYWDAYQSSYVAKVMPGELYVTQEDEILTTVVGSCISACIRDKQRGIGGMNHFMLPSRTGLVDGNWQNTQVNSATRYGNYAMEHVINEILKYGGRRQSLEVKLFGGGQIMQNMANIGQQNIDFIRAYIQLEQLNLLAEDLGDIYPRKILYYPHTGRVRVKKLRSMAQSVLEREKIYQRSLEKQSLGSDVELF